MCAGFLGFLLSLLGHAVVEVLYLRWLEAHDRNPVWSNLFGAGSCALPNWATIVIALVGIAGGIWVGFVWWRIVYIEHRHWRFQNKET